MKKAAHTDGAYTTLGQLVPKSLYKSVQVIEIIIVEDVLVYKLSQRFRRFVYIVGKFPVNYLSLGKMCACLSVVV